MSLWENLDNLEIAVQNVSQGINALEAMALGLGQAQDHYAGGLNALYVYLCEADREVHKHLDSCRSEL